MILLSFVFETKGANEKPVAREFCIKPVPPVLHLEAVGEKLAIVSDIQGEIIWYGDGVVLRNNASNLTITSNLVRMYTARSVANGCVSDFADPVLITALEDKLDALRLFPNPATTFVKVEASDVETITVIDLQGKVMMEKEIPADGTVDITSLPSGSFLAQLKGGQKFFVRTLIKR